MSWELAGCEIILAVQVADWTSVWRDDPFFELIIRRVMEILCSRCGVPMVCGPEGGCWCAELPHLMRVPEKGTAGCMCRECLDAELRLQPERDVVAPDRHE
jgi:hypothetical protein